MFVNETVMFRDVKETIENLCEVFNIPKPDIQMALLKETEEEVSDKRIIVRVVDRNGMPISTASHAHAVELLSAYMCVLSATDDHIPKVITQLIMQWWKNLENELKQTSKTN